MIPRLHLFEFHDQGWFPSIFRSALTEWLRALWDYSEAADVIAPVLSAEFKASGATRIVDLCSGSSGPMISVQRKLGKAVSVLATDKYPDPLVIAELERKTNGAIKGELTSIDATRVPQSLTGFRTVWAAFHHFQPGEARQILRSAEAAGQPIAIFEFTERVWPKLFLCFPASFVSVYLLFFRMRPRHLSWWIFTWILPVIPFTIAWDGVVSHLRCYTQAELLNLAADVKSYCWKTGKVRAPKAGLEITYLIGSLKANSFDDAGRARNAAC